MSRQCKILLSCEPHWHWNDCPFMEGENCLFEKDRCKCIVGPYYSESFEFDKCPYCTTVVKAMEEKTSDKENEEE